MTNLICIGKITAAHGIKGYVKVASYLDEPSDIKHYLDVTDKTGAVHYRLKIISMQKNIAIAKIDAITDRNDAEKLRHTELYIPRDALPEIDEGAFYWEDLKGLSVQLEDGSHYGKVLEMYNFGAGDIIEIEHAKTKKAEMFAFNEMTIPTVDLDKGIVTLSPPEVVMVASAEKPKKGDKPGNDNC